MKGFQPKWTRFRITLVFGFIILTWALIIGRAFQLQVLERGDLALIAERESHRVIKLNAVRGDIHDRGGEKLAVSLEADSAYAVPSKIKDSDAAAARLAGALKLDRRRLSRKLAGVSEFTWLKRQITPEEVARVKALNISGVDFVKESKRFYPNKSLAAHVLGFVGVDPRGLEGLELAYDEYLCGGTDSRRVRRDALGRIFLDQESLPAQARRGANATLTIDRRIQYITEKALADAVKKSWAKGGLALVVRPQTGEILAAAVSPTFNPNAFGQYPPARRRNRILTDTFEPGSIFKAFVATAALEEGLVRPLDRIYCENGAMTIGKHTIRDHHQYGWLPVNKVIKYSSNIGAVKIGEILGPAKLYRYLTRFGFGRKTGIDLPGESPGLLRHYKKWRKLDTASAAFGHGVSVTALQAAMAMSALANGGMLMRPYVLSRITDASGRTIKETKPQVMCRAVSSRTAREVRAMLRLVVMEGGTGMRADSEAYPAAGKTGTAQKLRLGARNYSKIKFYSSFLGYVPFHDPQLTILVALDEPWPEFYGGRVAAPVFREIASQILPILNVPPAKTVPALPAAFAHTRTENPNKASRAKVRTAAGLMPDLSGLSMRRVLNLMSGYAVALNFSGSGTAVWQKPAPGRPVKAGQACRVRFEQE